MFKHRLAVWPYSTLPYAPKKNLFSKIVLTTKKWRSFSIPICKPFLSYSEETKRGVENNLIIGVRKYKKNDDMSVDVLSNNSIESFFCISSSLTGCVQSTNDEIKTLTLMIRFGCYGVFKIMTRNTLRLSPAILLRVNGNYYWLPPSPPKK